MLIEVPGVGNVEFPDGTPNDVIEKALSAFRQPDPRAERMAAAKAGTLQVSPESAAAAEDLNAQALKGMEASAYQPNQMQSFLTGAAQGGTFGFGDEIVAGLHALSPNDTYDAALKRTRGLLDASRRDHPVAAYGGEIVGGAAAGGVATAPIMRGATGVASAAGRGAVAGGLEGFGYGLGSGEGDDRLNNAVRGAGIGAGVGFAAPLVIAGGRTAIDAVSNPVSSALNIARPTQASRAIEKAITRSGKSADDVSTALTRAASEGQPMYGIADELGPAGQRMLSGTARQPGEARQIISDALTQRQSGQGNRLAGFLADGLDATDTAAMRRTAMETARGKVAGKLYDAARTGAGPVDVRGALAAIDDRIGGMQGSGVAGDGIDGALARFRGRLAAKNPASSSIPGSTGVSAGGAGKTAVELSDFSRVLGVKQDVDDAIGVAVRAGRNNEARELGKLKAALDQALEGASAGYRTANDEFAKASRAIEAIDAGKAATSARARTDDVLAQYSGLPQRPRGANAVVPYDAPEAMAMRARLDDPRAAFRSGYADPLIARIDGSAPGVNKARPLLSEKTTTELGAMAKDPARLRGQIGRENTMFETANAALGGSRTADNLADISDVNGLSGNMLLNLLTGNWKAAATQAGDKALSALTGRGEATRELIAKALLSNDVQAALAPALAAAKTTAERSRILEALARSTGVRTEGILKLPPR